MCYYPDQDIAHEEQGKHYTGEHPSDEELTYRLLSHGSVDNHTYAGGDKDAQCTPGGEGAEDNLWLVAPFLQLRYSNGADSGCRGYTGAGDSSKYGARGDVGVQQTPGEFPQQGGSSTVKAVANPAMEEDLTHEDEERDSDQYKLSADIPTGVAQCLHMAEEEGSSEEANYSQTRRHWYPTEKE
ncbi:hypothetical protein ES703_97391 [subsurface metagenome]